MRRFYHWPCYLLCRQGLTELVVFDRFHWMTFSFRRKPLALLLCYGISSVLVGSYATGAWAQAAPLRVDPALLGLPPVTPATAPAPATVKKTAPAEPASAEVKPVEAPVVEARPQAIEPEEVKAADKAVKAGKPGQPVSPPKAVVQETPARLVPPAVAAQAVVKPVPAPAASGKEPTVVAAPPRSPREEEKPKTLPAPVSPVVKAPEPSSQPAAAAPVAASAPIPQPPRAPAPAVQPPVAAKPYVSSAATSGVAVSSLPPLRVDPALLGEIPLPVSPSPSQWADSGSAKGQPASALAQGGGASETSGKQGRSREKAAFGSGTQLGNQRVPSGPAVDGGADARLAGSAQTKPPQVPATGPRDEEYVPDVTPALVLRSTKDMEPLPKESTVPRPVFLSALRMGGQIDREFVAEEEAELRKVGTVLNADRLTYWPVEDEVEAEGNVNLEQGDAFVSGPKMRMKLEEQVGFFEQPVYRIKQQIRAGTQNTYTARLAEMKSEDYWNSGFALPRTLEIKPGQTVIKDSYNKKGGKIMPEARGEADRIDFEGENQMRLTNGTYTTCEPGNNDWYAKAVDLKLDYDREVAEGNDGTVYFLDVPIFYSPWLSFSLNRGRKSGFLAPNFGTNSDSGIEFALPYYWNIAPNMDATITPRVMSKRGAMLSNEFRYLNTAYGGLFSGKATADYLPNDRVRDGDNRYGFSLNHVQTTANGFSGLINYTKVSDDNYFTDLSSNVSQTSRVNLLQQGLVSYGGGGWWNATANVQQYQTLQPDPKNPNLYPYQLLPQITVNARKPDWYMTDSSFFGQYTSFKINERLQNGVVYPEGQRTVLYPQLALPYVTPGWYVTPKIGVNVRNYQLSGQIAGMPDSISVTLPIFSIDSGMTFERTSNWYGRDYMQTLEPRLYYVNIPYKDQSQIPIFDTARSDFNFAQIFSENQFSGWDRINSANQLTAALTTRLLEPSSGNEIARAMIGQRFYFSRNKVGLPTDALHDNDEWEKSDVLAAFSGQVLPKVYVDSAIEYNLANSDVKRFSLGTRYQPEPGKVLNAAYRYNNDSTAPIDQIDLSGQWPFSGRWSAVGRLNYSFKDDGAASSNSSQGGRMIQSVAGLEYNGGCWVVRGVIQQLALTRDNTSTSFFLQLELNDFSSVGSNPLKLLQRNIQGYSLINQPAADMGLGY